MARNAYDNKTPTWQRVTIWIIAIAMAGGTLLSFFFMVFAARNPELDTTGIVAKREEQAQAELGEKKAEYQKKIDVQTEELSKKYFTEFSSYKSRIAAFEPTGIGDIKTEDLKIGDGDEITEKSEYGMYYMGWAPSGKMFDSSFSSDESGLGRPLIRASDASWTFPGGGVGSVIPGWEEGLVGMKIDGVRVLTIPADKAYGPNGSGCDENKENCTIPPDTPLKFIVMAIPTPSNIPYPKGMMDACKKVYAFQYPGSEQEICNMFGYNNEEK